MARFPEFEILKRSLADRQYQIEVVENDGYTVIILSRMKDVLDYSAFIEIEDCGFRFTEVHIDDDGHVKAIFHRNENEGRFPDLT
jgi:hypothetical protein